MPYIVPMVSALGSIFFQDSVFGRKFHEILMLQKEGISRTKNRSNLSPTQDCATNWVNVTMFTI